MEHILESLNIDWITIEFKYRADEEAKLSYLVKNSKDRVIIIVEIEEVEELLAYTKKLPQSGDTIRTFMKEIGDDNVVGEQKITLAQYLWDLYIVGVYSNKEKKLDPVKVSQIERDRFIARKLFVEYCDEQELLAQLYEIIYPHKALDFKIKQLGESTTLNLTNLMNGLHHIDANNITLEQLHTLITHFEEITGGVQDATTD